MSEKDRDRYNKNDRGGKHGGKGPRNNQYQRRDNQPIFAVKKTDKKVEAKKNVTTLAKVGAEIFNLFKNKGVVVKKQEEELDEEEKKVEKDTTEEENLSLENITDWVARSVYNNDEDG